MNRDELYREGYVLVRKWYASHLRKLGGRRHRPLVADRLWDLMIDALLRAVDRFDGRVPFRPWLGLCLRDARCKCAAWAAARGRDRDEEPGRTDEAVARPERLDEGAWAEVDLLMTDEERSLLYLWAERRGAGTAAAAGVTRQAFNNRVGRMIRRLRAVLGEE